MYSDLAKKQHIVRPVREDIVLHSGPSERDGSPTWTIYDPAANYYYRIGWPMFEILSRLTYSKSAGEIVRDVNEKTTLKITPQDVIDVAEFLDENELTKPVRDGDVERYFLREQARKSFRIFAQSLRSSLFLNIPVVRPHYFLKATLPFVSILLTKEFFLFMMGLLVMGLFLLFEQFDQYMNTFMHFFTVQGLALYVVTIVGLKIIHELGHAYVATKYGVRVASMGFALILMYPIFYTETTGAWKIQERKPRVMIAFAGIIAELYVAAIALLLWHTMPDGALKSVMFMLSTVSIIGSLLVNLSPFMRFDGYYILADSLGIDNLQERGFDLGKWRMRKFLFGWKTPQPEYFSPRLYKILLSYAYSTWVYRFFLYLGIAAVFYIFTPKPAGAILMVIGLYWFIGIPLMKELQIWWEGRSLMEFNYEIKRLIVVFVVLTGFLAVPWYSSIAVPSVMKPVSYANVHTNTKGQIAKVHVRSGERVQEGQPLITLESAQLDFLIVNARLELERLNTILSQIGRNAQLNRERQVIESQIEKAQADLRGWIFEKQRLDIKAPFDGVVTDLSGDLHEKLWLGKDSFLLRVIEPSQAIFFGYIRERDLDRVELGRKGKFYSNTGISRPVPLIVEDIAPTNSQALPYADLASIFGGPIAVEENSDPESNNYIPHDSIYLITFRPESGVSEESISHLVAGYIQLDTKPRSFLSRFFNFISNVLVQESSI